MTLPMKIIPTEFTRSGINYRQLARRRNWAVYEQRAPHWSKPVFELVRIQSHDGYEIAGRRVEPSEFYPRSEDWGINGFTFHDLAKAMQVMADKAESAQ